MRITCPYCGERALEEFTYRGDATVRRPDSLEPGAAEAWVERHWGEGASLTEIIRDVAAIRHQIAVVNGTEIPPMTVANTTIVGPDNYKDVMDATSIANCGG